MIYERIKYEYEILENHIRRIQSELKNLPPGKPYYFLNYSGQKINNKYIYQKIPEMDSIYLEKWILKPIFFFIDTFQPNSLLNSLLKVLLSTGSRNIRHIPPHGSMLQHVFDENPVSSCAVLHHDVRYGANQPAILNDGRTAHSLYNASCLMKQFLICNLQHNLPVFVTDLIVYGENLHIIQSGSLIIDTAHDLCRTGMYLLTESDL